MPSPKPKYSPDSIYGQIAAMPEAQQFPSPFWNALHDLFGDRQARTADGETPVDNFLKAIDQRDAALADLADLREHLHGYEALFLQARALVYRLNEIRGREKPPTIETIALINYVLDMVGPIVAALDLENLLDEAEEAEPKTKESA